ncbi:MAG: hypothetical protein IPM61_04560 [Chlorobi bacterium]|nr:hypothetical protein [Chlorobiota bacterium]
MHRFILSLTILWPLLLLPIAAAAQTLPAIAVYFNKSVDTTLAYPPGNVAKGNTDLGAVAAQEIAKAKSSVDMAMYNLNVQSVVDALIAAQKRGVKVRVVGHVENGGDQKFQQLVSAGIPLITNPRAPSGEQQPLMHNKFFVIDARPGAPSGSQPVTMMGSWNATFAQTYTDPNNLVIIRDAAVTAAYLKEFQEMWGGADDAPNGGAAAFGAAKTNNTPHTFTVDGTRIDVYFSPSDGTASRINDALLTGQSSIYTANLTFTYSQFSSSLSRQKNRGADVRCIIDNVKDQGSQFSALQSFAEAFDWQLTGIFHHKYAVMDAIPLGTGTFPVVVTGSHNFTVSAETRNDENAAIIYSAAIANQFLQEFAARYKEVGGKAPFVQTTAVDALQSATAIALRAYPNPFNSHVAIAVEGLTEQATITIASITGERVASFALDPGQPIAEWDATDLAPGIYVATVASQSQRRFVALQVAR